MINRKHTKKEDKETHAAIMKWWELGYRVPTSGSSGVPRMLAGLKNKGPLMRHRFATCSWLGYPGSVPWGTLPKQWPLSEATLPLRLLEVIPCAEKSPNCPSPIRYPQGPPKKINRLNSFADHFVEDDDIPHHRLPFPYATFLPKPALLLYGFACAHGPAVQHAPGTALWQKNPPAVLQYSLCSI